MIRRLWSRVVWGYRLVIEGFCRKIEGLSQPIEKGSLVVEVLSQKIWVQKEIISFNNRQINLKAPKYLS